MKLKAWLLSALAPLTAVSVLAQASNSVPPALTPPPPVPSAAAASAAPVAAPAAPAPKKAKASKPKVKHKKTKKAGASVNASAKATTNAVTVLNPPVTATVKCDVLDVRGHGSFAGEVITHVKKGETVTVLEESTLGHVHPNEPAQWSRILMPTNTPVWVDADFIDPETKAVRVKRVNVRGGPGENYSIVARLDKGTVVKEIRKQRGWLEIETPINAFAFVASQYLDKQGPVAPAAELAATPPPVVPPAAPIIPAPQAVPPPAPQTVVVNVPTETAPAPAKAVDAAPAAPTIPTAPVAPAPTAASQSEQELAALRRSTAPEPLVTPATSAPPAATAQPEAVKEEAPETPRIVTCEGFVHKARNIQAPASFELHDIKTGALTEYLQPAPEQKKFKIFVGTRVRITGAEYLDPTWPRTPILHVQTVDLMP